MVFFFFFSSYIKSVEVSAFQVKLKGSIFLGGATQMASLRIIIHSLFFFILFLFFPVCVLRKMREELVRKIEYFHIAFKKMMEHFDWSGKLHYVWVYVSIASTFSIFLYYFFFFSGFFAFEIFNWNKEYVLQTKEQQNHK